MYFDDPASMKKRIRASYEITKGAGCRGMVAGQAADIEGEGKHYSKEMLDYIHINKTGALIVAAIRAGAQDAFSIRRPGVHGDQARDG